MRNRIRRSLPFVVGLVGLAIAMAIVLQPRVLPQNALDPEGPFARQLDRLWDPVFGIAVFVFFLVQGLIIFAVMRFKEKPGDRPRQVHGNSKFELGWTVAPAVLLAFVGFATVGTLIDLARDPEPDALQVRVTGHQWWWEYEYQYEDASQNFTTANELYIPTGRNVQLTLTSSDVIHNYWPPKLAGKLYAIPGREAEMTIEADQPGVYYGQCAEFCGLSHANMRLRVIAQDDAAYAAWEGDQRRPATVPAAENVTTADAAEGYELFQTKGCQGCHAVEGQFNGRIGPDLTHFQDRRTFAGAIFENNPSNLRRWLRNAPAEKQGSIMPNLNLSEEEITSLIAYLETLD